MDSPLFLTIEELSQLTGFKTPARQVEWLRTKGWRFEINGNRRAIVARKYAEKMLGCGVPAYSTRWRTRFHADGGQCSSVMADTVPR